MNLSKDEEVKAAILEAAKNVFQKRGLKKTTMEDIANEAGKGKSTLYYYYKSKDDLFGELTMSEFTIMISKAKLAIQQEKTAKGKLKKYISTMLIELKQTVSLFPLLKGEIKGNKELIESLLKQVEETEERIIIEILKQGLISGEFHFLSKSDLNKAANVIVGIVRGLELFLFLDNDDIEKIEIITRMIAEGI